MLSEEYCYTLIPPIGFFCDSPVDEWTVNEMMLSSEAKFYFIFIVKVNRMLFLCRSGNMMQNVESAFGDATDVDTQQ